MESEKTKDVSEWTKVELEALPLAGWEADIGEFNSLVILPTDRMHDSGYGAMDFVAVKEGVPFAKLSGVSDVIHLDGIGGYGWSWLKAFGGLPTLYNRNTPWMIDCLPKSGLLRIFTGDWKGLRAGHRLSSFELFSCGLEGVVMKNEQGEDMTYREFKETMKKITPSK